MWEKHFRSKGLFLFWPPVCLLQLSKDGRGVDIGFLLSASPVSVDSHCLLISNWCANCVVMSYLRKHSQGPTWALQQSCSFWSILCCYRSHFHYRWTYCKNVWYDHLWCGPLKVPLCARHAVCSECVFAVYALLSVNGCCTGDKRNVGMQEVGFLKTENSLGERPTSGDTTNLCVERRFRQGRSSVLLLSVVFEAWYQK